MLPVHFIIFNLFWCFMQTYLFLMPWPFLYQKIVNWSNKESFCLLIWTFSKIVQSLLIKIWLKIILVALMIWIGRNWSGDTLAVLDSRKESLKQCLSFNVLLFSNGFMLEFRVDISFFIRSIVNKIYISSLTTKETILFRAVRFYQVWSSDVIVLYREWTYNYPWHQRTMQDVHVTLPTIRVKRVYTVCVLEIKGICRCCLKCASLDERHQP